MTNRLLRIFSTLMIVTVLLSACSGTASTAKTPLRVGWSLWPGWYPMVIAQEQGLFEKHGVQVEIIYYDTYKNTMPALGSGMVDGGGLALGDTLLDDVAEDIKVVLITDESAGGDQILAGPAIKNIQDLKGKRIGVQAGTYGEVLVQEMLDKNNLLRSDVTFVEVPVEDVPNAIPSIVDAAHTYEPYASQTRAKGNNPIFTSVDTPGLLLNVFAFRKDILQQRPEDVKGFIAAWFEAVKYWQENPAAGNALIAQTLGISESEVSIEGIKIYGQAQNLNAFIQSSEATSIYYPAQTEIKFLSDKGIISFPITIDANFLDPSFLK